MFAFFLLDDESIANGTSPAATGGECLAVCGIAMQVPVYFPCLSLKIQFYRS